jgi:diguanylate cyclase (GGDEF)-like protein/PAS domain S-box-containing protein
MGALREPNSALGHAPARLAALEPSFRATFELAPIGIAHVGIDGRFLLVNQALCEILDYGREALTALTVKQVSHPEDADLADPQRLRLHAGELEVMHLEKRFLDRNGRTLWLNVRVVRAYTLGEHTPYEVAVFEDVTERKRAEQALALGKRRLRALVAHSADGIALCDRDGRVLYASPAITRILGFRRGEARGALAAQIVHEGDRDAAAQAFARALAQPAAPVALRARVRHKSEGDRLVDIVLTNRLADASVRAVIVNFRDVTVHERTLQELRDIEERYRDLIERSADAHFIVHQGTIVYANAAGAALYAAPSAEALIGRAALDVVAPEFQEMARARIAAVEAGEAVPARVEVRHRRLDGVLIDVEATAAPCTYRGRPALQSVIRDITDRKRAEARLRQLAQFDELTGMPNRNLLRAELARTLAQARRGARQAAVLFVDLDRFKLVNDTLGHENGNLLLMQVAARLAECVRVGDTVGRISGDEFAMVLADLASAEAAGAVAQRVTDALAAPFDLDGEEAFVSASIGIALHPDDGDDADTLLKSADAAMYRAKETGRNGYCFFAAEMNRRSAARLALNTDLRRALARDEFEVYYQPKISLRDGKVCGLEALLRWRHPERGLVAPGDFIGALEETGLIVPVGEWVVRTVCEQIKAWQASGLRAVPIAVNLSARQFHQKDLDARICGMVAAAGIDAQLIEFEITESQLMRDPEHAIRVMHRLRDAGIRISVDDFGTGYSSLAYLRQLPISALKIDRSFVSNVDRGESDATIVRAIIELAHNLQFSVVAEGVETAAQAALLRYHGCEDAQGYLFGRPVPAVEVAGRLTRLDPLVPVG